MHTIRDYAIDPNLALIDAANHPAFREFMQPNDFASIPFNDGNGTQSQVQALSFRSIRSVIERILVRARDGKADMRHWICSPDEFNLCDKLDTPVGKLMCELDALLNKKWAVRGLNVASVLSIAANPAVGTFLAIFSAVGFINHEFVELCECHKRK